MLFSSAAGAARVLLEGLEIWTWRCYAHVARGKGRGAYIKLPPLNMLPGILVRDDNHEARYLPADHPLVELAHDALDVRLHLVVGGDFTLLARLFCGGLSARGALVRRG